MCLEGLAVNPYNYGELSGLEITHRDGTYKAKRLMFESSKLQQEWLELLEPFKGISIEEKYFFS